MRTHGNLTQWNDDRGFGFITTPKGEKIFVHVSAFPRGERPAIGELISFETEVDGQNRTRAVRVMRPAKKQAPAAAGHERQHRPRRRSRGRWLTLVAVAGVAAYSYSRLAHYNNYPASEAPPAILAEDIELERAAPMQAFTCDGRTRCTQMRSCAEATYFLQKCPGTKMDGDGDGIPCEDQHCGH